MATRLLPLNSGSSANRPHGGRSSRAGPADADTDGQVEDEGGRCSSDGHSDQMLDRASTPRSGASVVQGPVLRLCAACAWPASCESPRGVATPASYSRVTRSWPRSELPTADPQLRPNAFGQRTTSAMKRCRLIERPAICALQQGQVVSRQRKSTPRGDDIAATMTGSISSPPRTRSLERARCHKAFHHHAARWP